MSAVSRMALLAYVLCWPATSDAQTVEVSPFAGYRFGGSFFERVTGRPVDIDGTRTFGGVVNVKLRESGLFAEALYTHQEARLTFPGGLFSAPTNWRISVDHWQGGGLQEFGTSRRVRPFLTGLLGLTRYAAADEDEIRFTFAAGGGVKLMPARRFGVRLDGRLFGTFADFDSQLIFCGTGLCIFALDADMVWQTEFSAALVVAFP
jgi:hypothetical protein